MVEKPDAVGGQYCPGRLRQVFFAIFRYFSYVHKVVHKCLKCQRKLFKMMEKTLAKIL